MNTEILKLLENDARLTSQQLSIMLDKEKSEIEAEIDEMEKSGTILGYKTIVDWEKTEHESVTAMIDVKLTPQRDRVQPYSIILMLVSLFINDFYFHNNFQSKNLCYFLQSF